MRRKLSRSIPLGGLALVLAVMLVACGGGDDAAPSTEGISPSPPPRAPTATATTAPVEEVDTGGEDSGARTVKVSNEDLGGSGKYQFNPKELSFSVGESIDFEVTAETEFHTFTVDELEIDEALGAGETVKFSYTFDKAGTFRLYCIPHEALGMEGTITVQ